MRFTLFSDNYFVPAKNCIVLHQKCTVLSGCNGRSCVDFFKVWKFVHHVRKLKLVVDEILAFPVAPKSG